MEKGGRRICRTEKIVYQKKKMETLKLRDEYIRLRQALKAAGLVQSGVDAKFVIQDGLVRVNSEVELRRGRKLREGDLVEYDGNQIEITV